MNCDQINKMFIPYSEGELSSRESEEVSTHLQSCKSCSAIYSELQSTYDLIDRRKELEPNAFLYTRIKQQLENEELRERGVVKVSILKKILQPVMVTMVLTFAVFSGIKLGNTYKQKTENRVIVERTTEYYLNDMQQESLEMAILND